MKFRVKAHFNGKDDEWEFEEVRSGNTTWDHITSCPEELARMLAESDKSAAERAVEKFYRQIKTFEISFSKEQNALFDALYAMIGTYLEHDRERNVEDTLQWFDEPWEG